MRGWDVAAGAAAAAADDDDNDNGDEKMDDDGADVDVGANDRGVAGCGVGSPLGGPLVVLLPPADDAGADDAQAGSENTGVVSPSRSLRMFEFAFSSPATKASSANIGAPTPVDNHQ